MSTIYVDPLFHLASSDPHAFRVGAKYRHWWCHMWSEDLDALHVMAQKIGMKRAWFQAQHADFLHYDLVPPRRAAALKLGAVEIPLQAYLRGERIAAPAGELMLPGLDTPPQQSPLARFLDEHA